MSALRKVRLRVGAGTAKPGAAIGQVSLSHLFFGPILFYRILSYFVRIAFVHALQC